jgi:hypothetical protein
VLVLAAVWSRLLLAVLTGLGGGCGGVSVEGEPSGQPDSGGTTPDAAAIDARPAPDADLPDAAPGDRLVFVTSQELTGNMGGLAGADAICQAAAEAAGLRGSFMAWLADSTASPATRMRQHPGPYRLTNGTQVAASWTDLTDGSLAAPIDRDENGVPSEGSFVCKGGEVWTSTTSSGELVDPDSHCADWTDAGALGTAGNVRFADGRWADSGCISITCQSTLPLYCFQQ